MPTAQRIAASLNKTRRTFIHVLPIIFGMLLLTSLVSTLLPQQIATDLFGHGELIAGLLGTTLGGIAIGHPLASYLLGEGQRQWGISPSPLPRPSCTFTIDPQSLRPHSKSGEGCRKCLVHPDDQRPLPL